MLYENLNILAKAVEIFKLRLGSGGVPSFTDCLREALYVERGVCPDCGQVGGHAQGCGFEENTRWQYKKKPAE